MKFGTKKSKNVIDKRKDHPIRKGEHPVLHRPLTKQEIVSRKRKVTKQRKVFKRPLTDIEKKVRKTLIRLELEKRKKKK